MTERITIGLQKAAVTLADSRDYRSAAEQLNVSEAELRTQIAALEEALSLKVFSVDGQHVEVTAAGRIVRRCVPNFPGDTKPRSALNPGQDRKTRLFAIHRIGDECPHSVARRNP